MFPQCKFSREFLHPRYWLTWFGLGVLWLWVQLPYPVLCFLGTRIGAMARPFLKRRESIARKNLELCFPQHSAEEREKMIAENFRSLGMALVETGMAWFWPDSRVRKWFDVEGLDNLKRAQMQNRGVMVVGVHFMSLELGGRVMGLCQPMMATYRPHNNQLMEWVQTRGRMRSNKAMIGRNNLRGRRLSYDLFMDVSRPVYCLRKRLHRSGTERGIGGLFFLRHGDPRCTHLLLHHVVNWR